MKRKKYQAKDNGKLMGATLTHMREVAFGKKTDLEIFRTCKRAIEMRNDQQMIDDARQILDRPIRKKADHDPRAD